MANLVISYSPHIKGKNNIRAFMRDVIIALMPALLGSVYFFGLEALLVCLTSAAFCVLFEFIWDKLTGKENTTGDLTAIVTGILLAFCLPASIPLYMVVIGDAFAIIIVKCFFGGAGNNFVNPALAARAFLLACWPVELTTYPVPKDPFGWFSSFDAVSGATPLAVIKGTEAASAEAASYTELFFGYVGGCIGEVSVLLLLIGAAYLVIRKVISLVIPVTYLATLGIFCMIFSDFSFLWNIMAGGVVLGGFFMATDYATSPVTKWGQFVYAFGAGLITGVIRIYGGYPEGVTYAILIMNIITPLIDKYIRPGKFGSKAVKA